jgi:hypothetical protein
MLSHQTINYSSKIVLIYFLNSFYEIIVKVLANFKLLIFTLFFLSLLMSILPNKKIINIICGGKLACNGCHALKIHHHYFPLG